MDFIARAKKKNERIRHIFHRRGCLNPQLPRQGIRDFFCLSSPGGPTNLIPAGPRGVSLARGGGKPRKGGTSRREKRADRGRTKDGVGCVCGWWRETKKPRWLMDRRWLDKEKEWRLAKRDGEVTGNKGRQEGVCRSRKTNT